MKILRSTFFKKRKSNHGNFELIPDKGWEILQSFIDYESKLLVVTTTKEKDVPHQGSVKQLDVRQFVIDPVNAKILIPYIYRTLFNYKVSETISDDGKLCLISQRIHDEQRNNDFISEKLYDAEAGTLVSSSESVAFNQNKRINLLDRHYACQKLNPTDLKAREIKQYCSNCKAMVANNPRYPKAICSTCLSKDKYNEDGLLVEFYNIDLSGGLKVICKNTAGEIIAEDNTHCEYICYIDSKAFVAREARFGGIVIQKK